MHEDWRPLLGGHRGYGCTDHTFYAKVRTVASLPVENTRQSAELALARGADFVEVDVVQSSDGELFCLHNVRPADHFFVEPPQRNLNTLKWREFKDLHTGRAGTGSICTLAEMLEVVRRKALDPRSYCINIEVKGTQGTLQPAEPASFFDGIASVVAQSGLKPRQILFSSFCLQSVIEMAHRVPSAQYAVLFQEGTAPRSIYCSNECDREFMYLPFRQEYIAYARQSFARAVGNKAGLGYVHPEISTLTADGLISLADMGLGVNCWALFEELTDERVATYQKLARVAEAERARFGIITDYLEELRSALYTFRNRWIGDPQRRAAPQHSRGRSA